MLRSVSRRMLASVFFAATAWLFTTQVQASSITTSSDPFQNTTIVLTSPDPVDSTPFGFANVFTITNIVMVKSDQVGNDQHAEYSADFMVTFFTDDTMTAVRLSLTLSGTMKATIKNRFNAFDVGEWDYDLTEATFRIEDPQGTIVGTPGTLQTQLNPEALTTGTVSVVAGPGVGQYTITNTATVSAQQSVNDGPPSNVPPLTASPDPVNQTIAITFNPPTLAFGGTTTVTAGANSGLPVTLAVTTPSVCTLNGSTITAIDVGTCTLTGSQAGNTNFNAAQASSGITVGRAAQTISNLSPAASSIVFGGTTTVSASASSTLNVTFSSGTPSICTVAGNVVTSVAGGTCTVQADQAGDVHYAAAPQVTVNLTVNKANQTIGTPSYSPSVLNVGTTVDMSATASSNGAVTFSSSTPAICTSSGTNGQTITGVAVGNCVVVADQGGNGNFNPAPSVNTTIQVGRGTQTIGPITFNPPSIDNNGGSTLASATASSGLPVRFDVAVNDDCSAGGINNSTITADLNGYGLCNVVAYQDGNANYYPAVPVAARLQLPKISQTIQTVAFAGTLSAGHTTTVNATVDSGLPATYTSLTPDVCSVNGTTVTGIKVGTCTIAADQAGNTSYLAAAQVTGSAPVIKGDQTINPIVFNPNDLGSFGTTTASTTATSGLPVTLVPAENSACNNVEPLGANSAMVYATESSGICSVVALQAGDDNYNPALPVSGRIDVVDITITKNVNPENAGTITCNPALPQYGGSTTCTAQADPGYLFNGFSGDCTGATCSLSNITSPKTITANFVAQADGLTITSSVEPADKGTVSCAPDLLVTNQTGTCTITMAPGYVVDKDMIEGTCPAGSWTGSNVWVTGPITASCTVNFSVEPCEQCLRGGSWRNSIQQIVPNP